MWCAVYLSIVCLFQNQLIVIMALNSCVVCVYPNIVCLFQNQLIVIMALNSCVVCSVSKRRLSVLESANCNNGAAFLCGV